MNQFTLQRLPYRPEIDGLRAVAVMSVILSHFGFPLRGGFVGVDIFFVISGFLIGRILWQEYDDTGRVALLNFFANRIRRLAPAFFMMISAGAVLGWFILLPFEFRELGKSAIAATVYLSNVFFYRQAGYFETISLEKPFLHTWSLAVEEQFYLFLPLCIVFLARWRWGIVGVLSTLWALSLGLCVLFTPNMPDAAFYLFPFRAWELLTGVLLAIWGYETDRDFRGSPLLTGLGAGLLVGAILLTPEGNTFPGYLAIFPVAGTALLLANGRSENWINRALSQRHVVLIGMMSYSLYLWHWPVLTLSTYLRAGYASVLEPYFWMALVFPLAWISWRFVETPVRRANWLPNIASFSGAAALSLTVLLGGFWIYKQDGAPDRFDRGVRAHMMASTDFLQHWDRCETGSDGPLAGLKLCHIGPEGPPRVLIWGDSHALAFKGGMHETALHTDTPAVIVWRPGCAPLFDLRKVESMDTPEGDAACTQSNTQLKQVLGHLASVDTILLIGRWAYYASGSGSGIDAHFSIAMHPTNAPMHTDLPQPDLIARAAQDTVKHLDKWGLRVFVLRQPPEFPKYDSRRAAREAAHTDTPLAPAPVIESTMSKQALAARSDIADAVWQDMKDSNQIIWLDPWPYLCSETECSVVFQNVGQYFDNDHITNRAAVRMSPLFVSAFQKRPETVQFGGTSE